MNLQQLRYVCEIIRCRLNMSRAANAVGATQPAVSQQIRLLEQELGVTIFLRSSNRLTGLTSQGEAIVQAALHVLADVAKLQGIAQNRSVTAATGIRVASTHAQARYALPRVIRLFQVKHPGIHVHITHKHNDDEGLWHLVQNSQIDLAITTDTAGLPRSLLALPCYPMRRSLIAPRKHPLLRADAVTLEAIAHYPLVTYSDRSHGRRRLMRAFSDLGYTPKVVVTAVDEDVIKACVAEGLGVAILASIVHDPKRDISLAAVDVTPLLESSITSVVVRRNMAGHEHIATFIETFCPKWTRESVAAKI